MSEQKQIKVVEKLSKDMTIDKESRDALKWILKEVEEEEKTRWGYIKEYLNKEWGHSNSVKMEDIYKYAYEYDENEGGISVDMKGKECRDEDLNDYIQRKITPELFEEEEKCEICGRNAYHKNDWHCSQGKRRGEEEEE